MGKDLSSEAVEIYIYIHIIMFVGRIYNSLYLVALVEIPFIIYVDKKSTLLRTFYFSLFIIYC